VVDASSRRLTLLHDACCLLNLYASRRMEDMLSALPFRSGVATAAAAESLYVERGGDGDDSHEREAVDLRPLLASGVLHLVSIETPEEASAYVTFAASLDDGEAMTCALAAVRGLSVASDDRRVRNVLGRMAPDVPVLTTSELVKTWVDAAAASADELGRVLIDIQQRSRFTPGPRDPLFAWWNAARGAR
jgi:hypothetical protein